MKSYGQLCSVARALDVVGDRWTLLIVRELLISGPLRFTELQRGLPGVATNLLTQRLRDLEEHDVLVRAWPNGRRSPAEYRLTERGAALDGVIRELLKWGAPTVPSAPDGVAFQMHWLSMPARYLLRDARPGEPQATVRFGGLEDGFDVVTADGGIVVQPCSPDAQPAVTVDGPGPVLVALLQGVIPLSAAEERGVSVSGDASALARILPEQPRHPGPGRVGAGPRPSREVTHG